MGHRGAFEGSFGKFPAVGWCLYRGAVYVSALGSLPLWMTQHGHCRAGSSSAPAQATLPWEAERRGQQTLAVAHPSSAWLIAEAVLSEVPRGRSEFPPAGPASGPQCIKPFLIHHGGRGSNVCLLCRQGNTAEAGYPAHQGLRTRVSAPRTSTQSLESWSGTVCAAPAAHSRMLNCYRPGPVFQEHSASAGQRSLPGAPRAVGRGEKAQRRRCREKRTWSLVHSRL